MIQKIQLKKLEKIVEQIHSLDEGMKSLSDQELSNKTNEFKDRLSKGETLDDLLPEAFAAICEADRRILNMYPYDVQILGGIALHQGFLAEMNTGEGKTLMATMPLYLNALTGLSTILITTNEYLACRDASEMGQVFNFMGLTVAAGVSEDADVRYDNDEKRDIYNSDIVYTTNSALGFDYLMHNLVKSADDRFMRDFNYVILDEADSVLLDGAQTPLVISGAPRVQSNLYELSDFFVTTLIEDEEYQVEEKKVWLTEEGISHAEAFFGIDNFYDHKHFEINRHVNLALRAHFLFEKEKDYVVTREGELLLLSRGSGRMLPGVKLQGCQHQAIEAKEGVKVSQENRAVASITLQNLFLLFPKMAGMSGTIRDAKDELLETYGKEVLIIPPNKPLQRIDYKDKYYVNFEDQFGAAIDMALEVHSTGQPVLIVASTIAETEYISHMFVQHKVPHSVLNANNLSWEAEIIKEAGQRGAVTIATAIAGRGTDIKLGDGVEELGGLAVIGVGRMENKRQERQARGRAGRQGEPGFSQFFVSLEDDVVNVEDSPRYLRYVEGKRRIGKMKLKRIINNCQKVGEENAVNGRKSSLDYDVVMQLERKLMYDTRNALLDGGDFSEIALIRMLQQNISIMLPEELTREDLTRFVLDNISYGLDDGFMDITYNLANRPKVERYLIDIVRQGLRDKEQKLGSKALLQDFMRHAALSAIDDAWVEQVDYLQQLRSAVSGRAIAQRNPVFEYQREALETFVKMEQTIYRNIVRNIMLSEVSIDKKGELAIVFP